MRAGVDTFFGVGPQQRRSCPSMEQWVGSPPDNIPPARAHNPTTSPRGGAGVRGRSSEVSNHQMSWIDCTHLQLANQMGGDSTGKSCDWLMTISLEEIVWQWFPIHSVNFSEFFLDESFKMMCGLSMAYDWVLGSGLANQRKSISVSRYYFLLNSSF